jgi:Protein of unknown function (DUF2652)
MTSQDAPTAVAGPLVLADISGYSSFLQAVAYEHRDDAFAGGKVPHAYAVISSLLDGIVQRLVPPFTLSKLEGDAVFAYATDGAEVPRGKALLDCIGSCYAGFREQVGAARSVWPCECEACTRIDELDLKFIVHAGPFVLQSIAGRDELVGPEVVTAHRLLKSRAAEAVGQPAFALVTDAASEWLDVPAERGVTVVEECEPSPPVSGRAYALP